MRHALVRRGEGGRGNDRKSITFLEGSLDSPSRPSGSSSSNSSSMRIEMSMKALEW